MEKKTTTKRTIAYLDSEMLSKLSTETKQKVIKTVTDLGVKIYYPDTAFKMLKYKKPTVLRYGIIPTAVSSKLRIKGAEIVSGNY